MEASLYSGLSTTIEEFEKEKVELSFTFQPGSQLSTPGIEVNGISFSIINPKSMSVFAETWIFTDGVNVIKKASRELAQNLNAFKKLIKNLSPPNNFDLTATYC